jgi:hypothetical protein
MKDTTDLVNLVIASITDIDYLLRGHRISQEDAIRITEAVGKMGMTLRAAVDPHDVAPVEVPKSELPASVLKVLEQNGG